MSNVLKFLVVGIVSLSIVLGLVIFILQEPLSNELSKTINPRGSCLEKFDILRNTGIASFSGGDRMTDYQFQTYLEFNKEQCKYYVFKWMPEHYPERNYVEKAWPHEYRLDLTEEVKQKLQDVGAWPDEFGQFSIKEKIIEPEKATPSKYRKILGTHMTDADISVKLFGDTLDSSAQFHFDSQCFFLDSRNFCTNDDYSLKFFIDGKQVHDITNYEIMKDDKILIVYD
jgi:hypothetical protein